MHFYSFEKYLPYLHTVGIFESCKGQIFVYKFVYIVSRAPAASAVIKHVNWPIHTESRSVTALAVPLVIYPLCFWCFPFRPYLLCSPVFLALCVRVCPSVLNFKIRRCRNVKCIWERRGDEAGAGPRTRTEHGAENNVLCMQMATYWAVGFTGLNFK